MDEDEFDTEFGCAVCGHSRDEHRTGGCHLRICEGTVCPCPEFVPIENVVAEFVVQFDADGRSLDRSPLPGRTLN